MLPNRPKKASILDSTDAPMSLKRVFTSSTQGEHVWIGPDDAKELSSEDQQAYDAAHTIIRHLAVEAPRAHQSGHPGGPLSAFTISYLASIRRDPAVDQPLRMSPGHLSILGYCLQYLLGRGGEDPRLASPKAIIDTFRTPSGLPGHIEAGIGDIPFGTGPLGKGVSHALGTAFGLKLQGKAGVVDVLLADGDAQEGQVAEAFRLATHLELDNLIVLGDFNDVQLSDLPSDTVAADFAAIAYAEGWNVIEVQDGNDPAQVNAALESAKNLNTSKRPTFICAYTTMGYGISFMEDGSNTGSKNYHGAPLSDEEAKQALNELPDLDEAVATYLPYRKKLKDQYEAGHIETDVELKLSLSGYTREISEEKGAARKDFGAVHLLNLIRADSRIYVLHADLAGSGGFSAVEKEFPDRVINVGVAEANMHMMAAGMRQTGLIPVTYTFAAFTSNEARASARLIDINCGHTRCGVIHDATHAGLSVGEDGETHQEQHYLNIPFYHTQVWMPADSNQAAAMAEASVELICEGHQSVFVYSPRTGHEQIKSEDKLFFDSDYVFNGSADLLRGAGDATDQVTVIASGITVHFALKAIEALEVSHPDLSVRLLNIGSIRPIDASAIIQAALETQHLIVVEDHNVSGGIATQVADIVADFALPCSLRRLGARHYFPSGKAEDLFVMAGIDSDSIVDAVLDDIASEVCGGEDAFVTAISELIDNVHHSVHRTQAAAFVSRLTNEDGYLEQLRLAWNERTCTPERLPSNDALLKKLRQTF